MDRHDPSASLPPHRHDHGSPHPRRVSGFTLVEWIPTRRLAGADARGAPGSNDTTDRRGFRAAFRDGEGDHGRDVQDPPGRRVDQSQHGSSERQHRMGMTLVLGPFLGQLHLLADRSPGSHAARQLRQVHGDRQGFRAGQTGARPAGGRRSGGVSLLPVARLAGHDSHEPRPPHSRRRRSSAGPTAGIPSTPRDGGLSRHTSPYNSALARSASSDRSPFSSVTWA